MKRFIEDDILSEIDFAHSISGDSIVPVGGDSSWIIDKDSKAFLHLCWRHWPAILKEIERLRGHDAVYPMPPQAHLDTWNAIVARLKLSGPCDAGKAMGDLLEYAKGLRDDHQRLQHGNRDLQVTVESLIEERNKLLEEKRGRASVEVSVSPSSSAEPAVGEVEYTEYTIKGADGKVAGSMKVRGLASMSQRVKIAGPPKNPNCPIKHHAHDCECRGEWGDR